jgi:hypothetical protein
MVAEVPEVTIAEARDFAERSVDPASSDSTEECVEGESAMKYVLLVYGDEGARKTLGEAEWRQIVEETHQHLGALKRRRQYLASAALQPTAAAVTVRIRDGERLVTDGPFAESKEQLGGFYLIDAVDLNAAIEIAASQPGVRWGWGAIEIRPVMELPGTPGDA